MSVTASHKCHPWMTSCFEMCNQFAVLKFYCVRCKSNVIQRTHSKTCNIIEQKLSGLIVYFYISVATTHKVILHFTGYCVMSAHHCWITKQTKQEVVYGSTGMNSTHGWQNISTVQNCHSRCCWWWKWRFFFLLFCLQRYKGIFVGLFSFRNGVKYLSSCPFRKPGLM